LAAFKRMIEAAVAAYPNLKLVATTLRSVKSATRNDWSAICWMAASFLNRASTLISKCWIAWAGRQLRWRPDLQLDDHGDPSGQYIAARTRRVGHDHPGDTSMVSRTEVDKLMRGRSARVER